ncbi:putative endonuclease from prophage, replication protein A (GpA) [Escherichia coli]|uniref:Putative endonuclease from prophage, replication protein A (GpA) n=1 Tax=Escherichia coli TaxID=562 RepID=A0A377D3I0_ECOLX|nr:putative endonuclease from prophage, replication protein A (GpA) [Escherichia coli]
MNASATTAFKATAARHRLDELLMLPQLNRDQIQRLATLTAAAFSTELERICDEVTERTGKGDDNLFTWLLTYQQLARMAIKTGREPHHTGRHSRSDVTAARHQTLNWYRAR